MTAHKDPAMQPHPHRARARPAWNAFRHVLLRAELGAVAVLLLAGRLALLPDRTPLWLVLGAGVLPRWRSPA